MDFCIFRSYVEWKSTLLLYDFKFFSSLLLTLVSSKRYLGRGKRSAFHSNKNIDEDIETSNKRINYLLVH